MSKKITEQDIIDSVASACQFISFYHPEDFVKGMVEAYENEKSDAAKNAIGQILINSKMCAMGHRPLCQDTGSVNIFVKVGLKANLDITKNLEDLLNEGVAKRVLEEGLIQKFDIEAAFAFHIASELPVGTVSAKEGIFFAIPQEFDVCFYGKAAHIAFPEKGINALKAGIMFMNVVEERLSELQKQEKMIFHIGKMSSGTIRNIIADKCILEGTHRSLSRKTCQKINNILKETAEFVEKQTNTKSEVKYLVSYDPELITQI